MFYEITLVLLIMSFFFERFLFICLKVSSKEIFLSYVLRNDVDIINYDFFFERIFLYVLKFVQKNLRT